MKRFLISFGCVFLVMGQVAWAQFSKPSYSLSPMEKDTLASRCKYLRDEIAKLQKSPKGAEVNMADLYVYISAAEINLKQDLFFTLQTYKQSLTLLDICETKIAYFSSVGGKIKVQTGLINCGYQSAIDRSYQPYQLFIPESFPFKTNTPQQIEVFLHGRMGNVNEIGFLSSRGTVSSAFGPTKPDHIVLFPFGRGNNGWRYAGEQDVIEALADVCRRYPIDLDKVVLRGFSMGGHGVWHMSLQHPGMWAAASPGAGFVDTIQYQNMKDDFPEWQRKLLNLYDPIAYSSNASNFVMRPYVGETDTFYSQHKLITEAFLKDGTPYKQFVGPNTGHKYEPETLKQLLTSIAGKTRDKNANVIDFVTYTLAWPNCKWLTIDALYNHWDKAEVHIRMPDEKTIKVFTRNIHAFHITPPKTEASSFETNLTISIESKKGSKPDTVLVKDYLPGRTIFLIRRNNRWEGDKFPAVVYKRSGLQGPIDDALFTPFLSVTPTGKAWNVKMAKWTDQEFKRFGTAWGRYFRGDLPTVTDKDCAPGTYAGRNLYLFGDPGSNCVLARIVSKLPITWTDKAITIGNQTFNTDMYLPMMIFPNPESPNNYVIINTGMTFSNVDMEGSNSLQFPHLPDFAIIKYDSDNFSDDRKKDTVLAGFFDEFWKLPKWFWTADKK